MIKFFKLIIFIASMVFVVYIGMNNYANINNNIIFHRNFFLIESFILSIIYAISLFFVALSWKYILDLLSNKEFSFALVWIWLKSNIYKYLPGNIFNYVSRQFASTELGIKHNILLKSNILETIILVLNAVIISSIILLLFYNYTLNEYFFFIEVNHIYIVLIFFIIFFLYLYKNKKINILKYWLSFIYYLIFFMIIGFIAYYILNYQMKMEFPFLLITAIYTFAWLIGFITPGAPGGIGVRETVFILLSKGILQEADAIVLSGILRFISIIGEIILFLLATYMLKKSPIKKKNDN